MTTKTTMGSRRGRPNREDAGDVERRLLDAALQLFLEKGFDRASCDAVSRMAGAGKASLYARYPSKERLFEAVIRRNAISPPRVETMAPGLNLEDRLRLAGQEMLEHGARPETLAMMRLVVATADRFPAVAAEASRIGWDAGRQRARLAVEAGPDRPDDIDTLVEDFIDLVFAPYQLRALLGDDPQLLREQAATRIDRALDALRYRGFLKRSIQSQSQAVLPAGNHAKNS